MVLCRRCFFFLICIAAMACAASEPAFMRELRSRYGGDSTIQMKFDVTIWWAIREKEEKKSGTIIVAPVDKFRIEADHSVWVSDGRKYWQFSRATNQVIIKRLLDVNISVLPSQIIRKWLHGYTYRLLSRKGRRATVAAQIDSGAGGHVENVTLVVDTKTLTVLGLAVREREGNTSTYTFRKVTIGEPVAEKVFTFEVPAGADVMDVRD